jgi:hypothetical protein
MKTFVLFSLLFSFGCTQNEQLPNFSRDKMLSMARLGDPTMSIKVGTIDKALVDCKDYKYRCSTGYLVVIKNLEMKALYYKDQKSGLIPL